MRAKLSRRSVVIVGGLVGVALLGVTLRAVGLTAIIGMMRRVGTGLLWILLIAGVRLAARAGAWTACAGGPSRLPFRAALAACIVGDGAGNLTLLGPAASEPAKVLWVRPHVGTVDAAASLAAETVTYSLAVAALLAAGSLAWVAAFAPAEWTHAVIVAVAASLAAAAGALAFVRRGRRGRSSLARRIEEQGRRRPGRLAVVGWLRRTVEMLRLLSHEPKALATVTALQVVFQAAAVAEVWVTLVLLGVPGVTFQQAFLLEYANRVVTLVFKFVPMRLGVDEVASGAMASLLGSGGTVGVAVALVRKARILCWSAVGLGLVAVRAAAARTAHRAAQVLAVRSQQVHG